MWSPLVSHGQADHLSHDAEMLCVYRSMPTAVENGAVQRVTGSKKQGGEQDIRQVLGWCWGLLAMSHTWMYLMLLLAMICDDRNGVRAKSRAVGGRVY